MTALDRLLILDVVNRWSHAADERDVVAFDRVVTVDSTLDVMGDVVVGREAVASRATDAPPSHQLRRHVRNSVIDELESDRAVVRSYYLLTAAVDGGRPSTLATGVYIDELTRTDDGWRISRRTVRPDVDGEIAW